MNIFKHKNKILIIIALMLVFFGYWFFFLSEEDAAGVANTGLTSQSPAISNTQYDKDLVTSLLGLNNVRLDVSVIDSKVYKALSYPEIPFVVNYSRESGRNNPFLPIFFDNSINAGVNIPSQVNVNNTPVATSTTNTPAATSTRTTPTPTPRVF